MRPTKGFVGSLGCDVGPGNAEAPSSASLPHQEVDAWNRRDLAGGKSFPSGGCAMRLRGCLFSILLSLIFSSCTLFAQSASTSTLNGDITDPSGAVVAGAEVILTDISTNASQKATSNQAGHYS